MTTEEKQLIFKDICARIPYGLIVHSLGLPHEQKLIGYIPDIEEYNIKPYLRPMSSMTKEERLIYEQRFHDVGRSIDVIDADDVVPHIDWLLSCHLDFRGLIPMGFALEATEGMYKQ